MNKECIPSSGNFNNKVNKYILHLVFINTRFSFLSAKSIEISLSGRDSQYCLLLAFVISGHTVISLFLEDEIPLGSVLRSNKSIFPFRISREIFLIRKTADRNFVSSNVSFQKISSVPFLNCTTRTFSNFGFSYACFPVDRHLGYSMKSVGSSSNASPLKFMILANALKS